MNTLLLCDDTDDVRDFLRQEVAHHPDLAVVGEAANGEEAIAQARLLQPDLMLLDLRMPILDGLSALPRILEVSPNTKVAAFSALDTGEARAMALAEGAALFIEKGTPLSVVIDALRGLCAPSAPAGPELISADKQRRLIELSLDLMCVATLDGRFVYVSPSWETILGWSPQQLTARPFADFIHPEDREVTAAEVRSTGDGNPTMPFENRYLCLDGSYKWLSWRSVVSDDDLIYASARDVTDQKEMTTSRDAERKRAEAEAISLREHLEQHVQQRTQELQERTSELEARTEELQASMGELDAFAYTVSHDLRAPLRAMDGFSRILLEDHSAELRPEVSRYLRFIRRSAQDMQSLVDGLLAFSRLGRRALAPVPISPAVLVRQAVSDLGDAAQRPDLHIEVDPLLPECEADPVLLKQVFVNLLSNAIKFTRGSDPARIDVGHSTVDERTVYFVRDNGVGFDSEYADEAFGVFQRLHRAEDFEGTGIGLAHVRRIIEKHNGRIWAEGHPGRGATFSFTIGTEGRS